jgi:hypothetical protein
MMEAICSSKTLVLTRATRRHIPENGSLKIKKKLNCGNACCQSFQNLLSFYLLSEGVKICKTIVLPVVLYGRESLSALSEEHIPSL